MNKVCFLLRADSFIASDQVKGRTSAATQPPLPPLPADSFVVIYLPATEFPGILESVMPIIARQKAALQTAFIG